MANARLKLKLAENSHEVVAAQRLRHAVFHSEYGMPARSDGIDIDDYDAVADHLIVVESETDEVVGTYRMISSTRSESFYSESEFDLTEVRRREGVKLELGRACIRPDYRRGVVVGLLWSGILKYAERVQARTVFGCSSVQIVDPLKIALAYRYLVDRGYRTDTPDCEPSPKYRIGSFDTLLQEAATAAPSDRDDCISPLLLSYLKAGARVCSKPALDRDFSCVDFMTVLDPKELSASFAKRFGGVSL